MKMQQAPQNVVVNGSFETSEFKTGDISFLVDMMSDYIYTNKERAILREISVNAHDATVRAGNQHIPIEVRIPTQLDNTVSFRDSGFGLCEADIRSLFCGIGISDKRDSDTETGCFGVGTLSPYSLCDSFTVTSYHEDHVTDYLCYRDESRKPQVSKLTQRSRNKDDHDDRTGLLISMTVKDKVHEFRTEARHVFKHWQGTTVDLSADDIIEDINESKSKIVVESDEYTLYQGGYRDLTAFQGNICYEIPDFDWDSIGEDLPITSYQCDRLANLSGILKFCVKEDALRFDVSREKLEKNDYNALKIKKKMAKLLHALSDNVKDIIEAGETPLDRARIAFEVGCGEVGRIVKQNKNTENLLRGYELSTEEPHTTFTSGWRGSDKSEGKRVLVGGGEIKYALFKKGKQTRIKAYLKDMSSGNAIVIFKDKDQLAEACISEDLLFDLDDLPKVTRSSSTNTRNSGNVYSTYKTFEFDSSKKGWSEKQYFKEAELVIEEDSTEPIFYVEINRYELVDTRISTCQRLGSVLRAANAAGYDVPKIYALKSAFLNSKKFAKHNFVKAEKWFEESVLPDLQESKLQRDSYETEEAIKFAKLIEHPELNQLIVENSDVEGSKIQHELQECFGQNWMGDKKLLRSKDVADAEHFWDTFKKKYSLLGHISAWQYHNIVDELARYTGGTVIAKDERLEPEAREQQILDNSKVTD